MKIRIKDPKVLQRIKNAEDIYHVYVKNTFIAAGITLLVIIASASKDSVTPLCSIAGFIIYGITSHLYNNWKYTEWEPFKHIVVHELEKQGYRYSHWNKFYKDGLDWHCSYPQKIANSNELEVNVRRWTNADNGDA